MSYIPTCINLPQDNISKKERSGFTASKCEMHYILSDTVYPEWNKTWSTEREKLPSTSFHEMRSNNNLPEENLWPNTDPAFGTNHIPSEPTLWKTVWKTEELSDYFVGVSWSILPWLHL